MVWLCIIVRARQTSQSWPATAEGNGGLSEPFEPLCYRKIDHSHQSRSTRHALVTGHALVTRKLLRIPYARHLQHPHNIEVTKAVNGAQKWECLDGRERPLANNWQEVI